MTNLLKFLFSEHLRFRGPTTAILLLMLVTLSYQVTFSFSFKYLVDDLLVPGLYERLAVFLSLLAAGAILSSISEMVTDYLLLKTGLRMQNELRYKVFRHLQMLPESYYRNQSPSSVVVRLSTDLNTMHAAFLALQGAVNAGLGLVLSLALVYMMNKLVFALLLVGLPVCFIIPKLMNRRVTAASDIYKTQENFNGLILQRLTFHGTIRAFGLQSWEYKRLTDMTDEVAPIGLRAMLLQTLMGKSVSIALLLLNVAIIAVGAYLSRYDLLTIGVLVSFQSFFLRIGGYASSLSRYFPQFVQANLSLERLDSVILNQQNDPAEVTPTYGPIPELRDGLEMTSVSFGYTEENRSIQGISLTIPQGTHCAIVGSSGSGKTSIVNLLMRFYEPREGGIFLDRTDIRQLPLDLYRRMIAYVPQDVILFDCSFRENIRLGRLTATDEEVEAAAHAADIHEWILSQPGGYEGMAGEGGLFLSGGQKQRIALARAFVRQAPILLLDEATSALDPGTEQSVNRSLRALGDSTTIISVTHRLQNIEHVDRIYVMNKGELAGFGTHAELLRTCDAYRTLWSKQNGFIIRDDWSSVDMTPERLKHVPLFRDFDDKTLEETLRTLVTRKVEANETVIRQGEYGSEFFIMVRGRVEVLRQEREETERSLAVLEDGDHFGEMALLKQIPRTATIRTLTPCVFLVMHRELFQQALSNSPQLKQQLEQSYEERVVTHQ